MLAKTRRRVRYLALFILLIPASNSVGNCSYLYQCTLVAPTECELSGRRKANHQPDPSLLFIHVYAVHKRI
jgi:hypothetical protein